MDKSCYFMHILWKERQLLEVIVHAHSLIYYERQLLLVIPFLVLLIMRVIYLLLALSPNLGTTDESCPSHLPVFVSLFQFLFSLQHHSHGNPIQLSCLIQGNSRRKWRWVAYWTSQTRRTVIIDYELNFAMYFFNSNIVPRVFWGGFFFQAHRVKILSVFHNCVSYVW